jgi:hypothetical protein
MNHPYRESPTLDKEVGPSLLSKIMEYLIQDIGWHSLIFHILFMLSAIPFGCLGVLHHKTWMTNMNIFIQGTSPFASFGFYHWLKYYKELHV